VDAIWSPSRRTLFQHNRVPPSIDRSTRAQDTNEDCQTRCKVEAFDKSLHWCKSFYDRCPSEDVYRHDLFRSRYSGLWVEYTTSTPNVRLLEGSGISRAVTPSRQLLSAAAASVDKNTEYMPRQCSDCGGCYRKNCLSVLLASGCIAASDGSQYSNNWWESYLFPKETRTRRSPRLTVSIM